MSALLTCVAWSVVVAASPGDAEGESVAVPAPIQFELGKPDLKPESQPSLQHLKALLLAQPDITRLRVEVHTDSLDLGDANQELSERRAASVVAALVKTGVPCERLVAVGFGGKRPIATNETARGRAQNRRTRFVVAERNGKPTAGPIDGGGVVVPVCVAASR